MRLTRRGQLLLGSLMSLLLVLAVGGAEALGTWVSGVTQP